MCTKCLKEANKDKSFHANMKKLQKMLKNLDAEKKRLDLLMRNEVDVWNDKLMKIAAKRHGKWPL